MIYGLASCRFGIQLSIAWLAIALLALPSSSLWAQTDGLEKVRCVALELYVRSSDSSTTELVDVLKGYLSSKSGIHLKSLTSTPTRKRAHVSRVSPRRTSLQNRNCR